MADGRTLKLLLIEDNLEDENLIREALIEVEEKRQWGRWNSCYLAHAEGLSDGLEHLAAEQFDAILLNLSLPDAPSLLDAFQTVHTTVAGPPIIVLADEDDAVMAQRLIREGAQDVVIKAELECAPLARSIRHAIERQRRWSTIEAHWFCDELTGTSNRQGFLFVAERHLRIARRLLQPASFVVLDFQGLSGSKDATDLAMIRTSEVARIVFPEDCLIGRIEPSCIGLLVVGMNLQEAQLCADSLRADLRSALGEGSVPGLRLLHLESQEATAGIEELLARNERPTAIPAMLAD